VSFAQTAARDHPIDGVRDMSFSAERLRVRRGGMSNTIAQGLAIDWSLDYLAWAAQ
jgi:hypothetical protein